MGFARRETFIAATVMFGTGGVIVFVLSSPGTQRARYLVN